MKIRVDLHKKEIRALMTCLSYMDTQKINKKQKNIIDKVNIDRLYVRLSNILYENTFPGNLGPNK